MNSDHTKYRRRYSTPFKKKLRFVCYEFIYMGLSNILQSTNRFRQHRRRLMVSRPDGEGNSGDDDGGSDRFRNRQRFA